MRRSRASLAFVILILVSTIACLPGSSKTPERSEFNPDPIARQVMHDFNLPGMALVVVQGDKVTTLNGYGEVFSGGPVFTGFTPLTIGSLSKSFTALAILQLVEQGKIKLDETVVTYLPWFRTSEKARSDRITIRHLLNQTSGLSSAIGLEPVYDYQPDYTLEQRLRNLSEYQLTRPAGDKFEYSNTNYLLLGALIETVSGSSYAEYMRANVFSSLDMQASTATLEEAKANGLATGHTWWFGFPFPSKTPWYQDAVPAGYIISTAEDMGHYLIAQLNGGEYLGISVLSSDGIAEMQHGAVQSGDGQSYGMGWVEGSIGKLNAVYHDGDAAGYTTSVILDPDQKIGVAVLCNASSMLVSPTNTLATQIYQSLHDQSTAKSNPTTTTLYLIVDLVVLVLTLWMVLGYLFLHRWWKRLGEWRQKGAGTRFTRILIPIVFDLLWPYFLLVFIPNGAGFPMWRVMNIFQPDLSIWLQVFAWASVVKGLLRMVLFLIFIRSHKSPNRFHTVRQGSS